MNSRERVVATLSHERPDRIPFDLGTTLVTGITRGAYVDLANRLGHEAPQPCLYDVAQQVAEVDESILDLLGVDTRGLIPNFVRKSPELEEHEGFTLFKDEWGLVWKRPENGLYFDVVEHPLAGTISEKDIEEFPWPNASNPALLAGLREKAEAFHDKGKAIILESICAGVFEMCCRMRGMEQFFMDLVMNPDLACALMDKFVDIKIDFYQLAAEQLDGYVQFIREGDDMAGQEALLLSPDIYREHIKPRHARLFQAQRSLFKKPFFVFFHSDGAVYDLIPDFIECGVDVLNPVQAGAKGMDTARLKESYGDKIAFWGGAVEPALLASGTTLEIRRQARERIRDLSPGGGYVFGTIHNVQDDVPADKFLALWDAFKALRDYGAEAWE